MDYTTLLILLLVLGYLIHRYCFRGLKTFQNLGIDHQKPWPVFGNMGPMILQWTSPADGVHEIYTKLNPTAKYIGFYDFLTPVIILRDPELIKLIAVKHFDNFVNHRTFVDETVDPLFGKNLFSLHDDRWKEIRSLLSPAFTSSKMKSMFKLMQQCGTDFTDYLNNKSREVGEFEMELKDAFTRYTNDVIATCVFGIKVDSMRNLDNEFYVLGREATNFDTWKTMKFFIIRSMPWVSRLFKIKIVDEKCGRFFMNVVKDTIRTRDEKGIVRPDMIQLMMESRGKRKEDLTIEDMTSQAFIFFFGGFDTTSTHMCFVCHELAVNEIVQKKLQDEIDLVLMKNNGEVGYEAINEMKYLEAVMYEALRMYPVVIFTDRMCNQDFVLPPAVPGRKSHTIKKGEIVWFPVYSIQRDPKYFKEPDKFQPERFMAKENIENGAYLPFGIGPRMCIGNRFALLETKVLLFNLLSRINLRPCKRTNVPMKLNRKGFSMLAEGGFWIKFQSRNDSYYDRVTEL